MTKTKQSVLASIVLLAAVAAPAEATTIVYTDRDVCLAAAGDTILTTFNDPTVCVRDAVFRNTSVTLITVPSPFTTSTPTCLWVRLCHTTTSP